MDDAEIDKFVISVVEEKNLPGLTPEGKAQVVAELKEILVQEINRAVLNALPDKKLDELNHLMDSGEFGAEDVQNFVANCGVDVPKVTTEALMYFRAFYLGDKA